MGRLVWLSDSLIHSNATNVVVQTYKGIPTLAKQSNMALRHLDILEKIFLVVFSLPTMEPRLAITSLIQQYSHCGHFGTARTRYHTVTFLSHVI